MSIRQKMLTWLLVIAAVVVFSNSFFLYKHWMEVETVAVNDAESTAHALSLGLSFSDESGSFSPMYKTPAKVQNYVEHIHSTLKEDLVMVDDKKKIVGDAVPENVGKIFDHDKNNEIGQTIRDGITRIFIERSTDYPEGIRQLVVPLKTEEGETIGAVIMEYTAYYNKYRAEVIDDLKRDLTISFIVLFMALVIGYFMARNVTNPILRLKKASDEIAAGNLDVIVGVESKDEIGDLAAAFNTMVALRKAAEEAVRESEDRFRKLFENSNDAIFIHTMTGEILDANPQAENMTGYPVAVLKTMPVPALHPPEELETCKKAFEETISKGATRFESRFLHSGGGLIDVEISARIVDREKGIIQGIARDITERKQAEEWLQLRTQLLDSANDAIFVHDLDGNFIYLNEVAWKSRGYTRDELMGMNLHALDVPEYEKLIEARGRELEKGPCVFESAHRRKDGSVMPIEINARLIELGGRKLVISAARDITERKQAEEALRSAHDDLLKKSGRLEMFQQVAVNREMRMVEMKDEVNGLLERLGEPRKYVEVDSLKKR